jgi:glycerol-3-phosphate dehydrogenase
MPITQNVVSVCHEGMRPVDMLQALMGRQTGSE